MAGQAKKKNAPKKTTAAKSAKKSVIKAEAKKPAKKKPHLKLVPPHKTNQTVSKKKKNGKESVGDVFKRLLEAKEQRRKESNPGWFDQHGRNQQQAIDHKHQQKFARYNGPRRKAA
ncbi:MAG: hypothetical protein V4692_16580 [Bdellovibrionota bacterium]